jgi:hypothetical protein
VKQQQSAINTAAQQHSTAQWQISQHPQKTVLCGKIADSFL